MIIVGVGAALNLLTKQANAEIIFGSPMFSGRDLSTIHILPMADF